MSLALHLLALIPFSVSWLPWSEQLCSTCLSAMMFSLIPRPQAWNQSATDWNLRNHESKQTFPSLSWLPQLFCHSNEKQTNTFPTSSFPYNYFKPLKNLISTFALLSDKYYWQMKKCTSLLIYIGIYKVSLFKILAFFVIITNVFSLNVLKTMWQLNLITSIWLALE